MLCCWYKTFNRVETKVLNQNGRMDLGQRCAIM